MVIRSPIVNVMIGASRLAARGLSRDFGEINQLQVSKKGTSNFLMNSYNRINKTLRSELNRMRPEWPFLEKNNNPDQIITSDYKWIIDPLDSPNNLKHGIPHFCISTAVKYNEEIVAAVIYDPMRDELFMSEKGSGAFLNHRRIRVSSRQSLNDSIIAVNINNFEYKMTNSLIKTIKSISDKKAEIRLQGSSALDLAYVASGRYEGFWSENMNIWNFSAGSLMIKEAGGTITNITGKNEYLLDLPILATNTEIHQKLLSLL